MTGNDDLGTMSAWYVFSSLGLYPTMSGANFLAVSSPQFPSATVRIGDATLRITAPGASDANRYIQSVKLHRAPLTRNWVSWADVARGGTLAHTLGTRPSKWGTATADQPPSVNQAPADDRRHVDASVRPASAALPAGGTTREKARFTVDVVAQAPSTIAPRVTATAPAGWTASVRPGEAEYLISSNLPTAATVTVTVTAPRGVAAGTYPVDVTVSASNVEPVRRSVSVVVRTPTACTATGDGCAVDLGAERTVDGTATVAAPAEGNFDGGGWSYDAALLPPAGPVTWSDVTYQAPDPSGTAKNFVRASGQSLLLPPGKHRSARLVATTHNGPVTGTVTVGYTDGTTAQVPVTVADWCAGPASGTTTVLAMPHRIKAGQGTDGPPVNLFGVPVALDPAKELRSLTLPNDSRLHLYALSLT
jgi:hypothetical protein